MVDLDVVEASGRWRTITRRLDPPPEGKRDDDDDIVQTYYINKYFLIRII